MSRTVNLVLVAHKRHATIEAMEVVAAAAREHEPRLRVAVLKDRPHPVRRLALARHPSLYFASRPIRRFAPLRGRVFDGATMDKAEECVRLASGGIGTPRTVVLTEHEMPDSRTSGRTWSRNPATAGAEPG